MTEELKKTIENELAELSKEGQEAVNTVPWLQITEDIGNKYALEEDELEKFRLETLLVLVGVTDLELYPENIENQVPTTGEKSRSMAEEAYEKIFTPINTIFKENINKNLEKKSPLPSQNLNFILSGGNYGAFLDETTTDAGETQSSPTPTPPTLAEIKANVQKNTSLIVPNKPKITDIKSKFVI